MSSVLPAALNRHMLVHTLNCHLVMHTLFVHGFMNTPISDQHQGCPAKAAAPSFFTQLLRSYNVHPYVWHHSRIRAHIYVIHPFAVQLPPRLSYTANPQVPPLQSSPSCLYIYSWELEFPPLTLAGTTPSLRYVFVVHLFAVSTSHAVTTASKPVRDHAYPLLVFHLEILLPTAVSTS